MKLKLLTLLSFFFFFFNKHVICNAINALNEFHFKDVKQTKGGLMPNSTMLVPLIKDLEANDEFYPVNLMTYDEISFPNPFEHPEACVLSLGISHSWLCDPSHRLNMDEQINIESILLKIRDTNYHKCSNNKIYYYQVAVAIVPDIKINKNNSFENSTQYFANNLLKKWGIGNKECHDGILLVYIVRLGSFIIAKREGVKSKELNEIEIKKQFMNTYFATGSLNKAFVESLNLINKQLPTKPQELTRTGKAFLILMSIYFLSIIVAYFLIGAYGKKVKSIHD
ncbi:MOLO1 domain-containing protein, putative [Hepatocystis sp. ex Piliocolobus tephrosceles]|nr:MOLO1 domain-containing protein, putative [Hepatocystis sp. ex Piliocolobus tephrosceles]